MFKTFLAALALMTTSTAALAGSGACEVWDNPSVLASVVLDDLKLMLDTEVPTLG
jgi:hypothetical protein